MPPRQLGVLLRTLALASTTLPPSHRLANTYFGLETSGSRWAELATQVFEGLERSQHPGDILLDITALTLQAMRSAHLGDMELCWKCVGEGLRRGAGADIFDSPAIQKSRKKSQVREYLDLQPRFMSVAHRLLLSDRWIAFNNLRPLGISRADLDASQSLLASQTSLRLSPPSLGINLRLFLERTHILMLEAGRVLRLQSIDSASSSAAINLENDAFKLLANLEKYAKEGDAILASQTGITCATAEDLLQLPPRQALTWADWKCGCAYITASSLLHFVLDQRVSSRLRTCSLLCAGEILSFSSF